MATFRSDMTVKLIRHSASDDYVVSAARVSTQGDDVLEDLVEDSNRAGLIRYLMRERHGSPFEHTHFVFYIQAPLFVIREIQRHRMSSFNEESGRYRQLEPVFYLPDRDRKLVQVGKPGRYTFEDGTAEQYELMEVLVRRQYTAAYDAYTTMLEAGIAREVARIVLPLNIYSSMYMTVNARSLMNFLSLRVGDPEAAHPSNPQREIEMVAEIMETYFAHLMPLTYAAYEDSRRVAP
ncbi:MAG: FAD-dependent thymidylate synthase [Alphaproteobacteria bacterium]|nr:MAG: FAD-dependent thymidylate synthase [Alphaproteobacteria bacterium]